MNFRQAIQWRVLPLAATLATGCASSPEAGPTEAQQHFAAGLEEAFAMLQRSGIEVVRIVGPFQRPVVQWQPELTLAQVILEAGYIAERDPQQILIQRGPSTFTVDPGRLLSGEHLPVESGDVIHVVP
jgi:hypothetical protein